MESPFAHNRGTDRNLEDSVLSLRDEMNKLGLIGSDTLQSIKISIDDSNADLDAALEAVERRIAIIESPLEKDYYKLPRHTDPLELPLLRAIVKELALEEQKILEQASTEILEGKISLQSVRWIRAAVNGNGQNDVWFEEAETIAGFPEPLLDPQAEIEQYLSRRFSGRQYMAWPDFFSPLANCDQQKVVAPKLSMEQEKDFQIVTDWYVQSIKDPKNILSTLKVFYELIRKNEQHFGVAVPDPASIPVTTISELEVTSRSDTIMWMLDHLTDLEIIDQSRSAIPGVKIRLGLQWGMVRSGDSFRSLDLSNPNEVILLQSLANAVLEEWLHVQQHIKLLDNEVLKQEKLASNDADRELDLLSCLSALGKRFFVEGAGRFSLPEAYGDSLKYMHEVDVLGEMIELFQKHEIPISQLRQELFVAHPATRDAFVLWLHDQGVIPESHFPAFFLASQYRSYVAEYDANLPWDTVRQFFDC